MVSDAYWTMRPRDGQRQDRPTTWSVGPGSPIKCPGIINGNSRTQCDEPFGRKSKRIDMSSLWSLQTCYGYISTMGKRQHMLPPPCPPSIFIHLTYYRWYRFILTSPSPPQRSRPYLIRVIARMLKSTVYTAFFDCFFDVYLSSLCLAMRNNIVFYYIYTHFLSHG